MEYAYSILMGAFAAGILLYAAILALTKDYNLLPFRSRQSVKPKNSKRYAAKLAGVVALVALSPALSALVGLWNLFAAVAVLLVSMVLFLWLGTKLMKNVE